MSKKRKKEGKRLSVRFFQVLRALAASEALHSGGPGRQHLAPHRAPAGLSPRRGDQGPPRRSARSPGRAAYPGHSSLHLASCMGPGAEGMVIYHRYSTCPFCRCDPNPIEAPAGGHPNASAAVHTPAVAGLHLLAAAEANKRSATSPPRAPPGGTSPPWLRTPCLACPRLRPPWRARLQY